MDNPLVKSDQLHHLDPAAAEEFLKALPVPIREAIERRAREIDFPAWAILESLIATALDDDAVSFLDCKPRY